MNTNGLTLGSLFDGIGGFPYAASFYGIKALWASEIIPECVSVTRRHFPDMEHLGDITKLDGGKLPPVDIITFGSPCQDLSVAGQRKGLAGERSGLFLEAIRIINEMQEATDGEYPKFALWENVPGALSSSGRRDFKAVLEAFAEAEIPMPGSGQWANAGMVRGGRADIAWCVYDAQYFGVPQRRRRIFLVADFRGGRSAEILFVPKSLPGHSAAGEEQGEGAAAVIEDGIGGAGAGGMTPAIAMRMKCGCEGGGRGPLLQIEKSGTLATGNDQYLFMPQDVSVLNDQGGDSLSVEKKSISPTLRSQAHGNLPITAYSLQGSMIGRKDENGPQGDGVNENVSFTLNTIDRHAVCMATGQANAEVMDEKCPTIVAGHEQPIVTHPKVAGTLCASGAGLSRPAGMGSEPDFCIVSAGMKYKASSQSGSIGYQEEKAPTLLAGQQSGVMKAYVIGSYKSNSMMSANPHSGIYEADTSRTLDLNAGNPGCNQGGLCIVKGDTETYQEQVGALCATDHKAPNSQYVSQDKLVMARSTVRRLTPTECERLQGFPDGWTETGADGEAISDTKRYQMLGNSVAVPCVAYIMQGIRDAVNDDSEV